MNIESRQLDLTGTAVLVLEDEFYLATEVEKEIQQHGGMVMGPYASPADGLAGLAAGRPDCALVDINLGEGPSFAMADALQARGVPFAFLTGYDAGSIPARFEGIERIEKPTNRLRVLEALTRLRTS